jgi:hypothetical protein
MPTTTPVITPEALTALALGLIQNLIVLVGLDVTDAQKAAITGLITSLITIGLLVYSSVVRHGQAHVEAAKMAYRP